MLGKEAMKAFLVAGTALRELPPEEGKVVVRMLEVMFEEPPPWVVGAWLVEWGATIAGRKEGTGDGT